MAEHPDFSEDEILRLAEELRGFGASTAYTALSFIGGRLLQVSLEQNLAEADEQDKPRPYYRGFKAGAEAVLNEAERIVELAGQIKKTPPKLS